MTKISFQLREHRKEDIPRILYVIKTAFAEQRGKVNPPSSAERKTIGIVEQELQKAKALVVEIKNEIIACVFYQPKGNSIYVDRLAVLPEFRKQGIGKMLMCEVEKLATELGFTKLSLSVRIELTDQQKYYSKMGYKLSVYKSHKGFKEPTYVVMTKDSF